MSLMNNEEALDNYILLEFCKQEGIQEIIREDSVEGEEQLKETVEKV